MSKSGNLSTYPLAVLALLADRPVAYHPALANLCGSVTSGLFLGQAMYWQTRCPADRDGWWWHGMDEWRSETALTRSQVETARKCLKRMGILEEIRQGVPAKLWFRIDFDRVCELLNNEGLKHANQFAGFRELDCGNPANLIAGNRRPLLRAEITPEITKPPAAESKPATSSTSPASENQGGDDKGQKQNPRLQAVPLRPGMVPDDPELVGLAEHIASKVASGMGCDSNPAAVSAWLSQLRLIHKGGPSVEAMRLGWEWGRTSEAYGTAVMSPNGFNRHHEGLIVKARQAAGKSSGGAKTNCRGVNGSHCESRATMGSSGRNTHCPSCYNEQGRLDTEGMLADDPPALVAIQ